MRLSFNAIRIASSLVATMILGCLLTGCSLFGGGSPDHPSGMGNAESSRAYDTPLRTGDRIKIDFAGTPTPLASIETEIKGDGTVRLDYIGNVTADGKTSGELEKIIQSSYVPIYYTHMSVTVTPVLRFFYVDGEINGAAGGGKQAYTGQTTVTRAIASAGGFSPFADRRHVLLFRYDGTKKTINCIKALGDPKLDLPVYPGDKIVVRRRYY